MTSDKRTGFLATLKVGDTIKVLSRYSEKLVVGTKITRAGYIYAGDQRYSPDGYCPITQWEQDAITEK